MGVTDEQATEMADWLEHELDGEDIVEMRAGPGRPPLPPGEAVDEVLTIRLTAAEKRRFQELAEARGHSQSEEGRLAILQELVRVEARDELRQRLSEVRDRVTSAGLDPDVVDEAIEAARRASR